MKGKGLLLTGFLMLALAMPSISLAKNKQEKKQTQRKFDICEIIEEQKNFDNYFKEWSFAVDTSKHYPITSPFGIRKNPVRKRIGGPGKKYHTGWDIGVYREPVFAMADGIVKSGYSKTEGYFLKIKCDKQYHNLLTNKKETVIYEYLHLHKRLVKNKSHVKKGQKIAISGNSGITNGAHLDIHISIGEKYEDPALIFPNYKYIEKD